MQKELVVSKFTINLTPAQNQLFDKLQILFEAASRAELIRKLLAIGLLVIELKDKGQYLMIGDAEGHPQQTLRFL